MPLGIYLGKYFMLEICELLFIRLNLQFNLYGVNKKDDEPTFLLGEYE